MSHTLHITELRNFKPITYKNQKASIDVVFNDALVVRGFKVVETTDKDGKPRLFVGAPSRSHKGADGRVIFTDIVACEKGTTAWNEISTAILNEYHKNVSSTPTP